MGYTLKRLLNKREHHGKPLDKMISSLSIFRQSHPENSQWFGGNESSNPMAGSKWGVISLWTPLWPYGWEIPWTNYQPTMFRNDGTTLRDLNTVHCCSLLFTVIKNRSHESHFTSLELILPWTGRGRSFPRWKVLVLKQLCSKWRIFCWV